MKFLKSCHILTGKKSIKCLEPESEIFLCFDLVFSKLIKLMSTEMNLTDINLIRENSFDKLVLKLNYCGFYSIFLKLGFLPTIFEESRYSFPAEKYVDNNLLLFVFDEIC